jgi:hypothetical protein
MFFFEMNSLSKKNKKKRFQIPSIFFYHFLAEEPSLCWAADPASPSIILTMSLVFKLASLLEAIVRESTLWLS